MLHIIGNNINIFTITIQFIRINNYVYIYIFLNENQNYSKIRKIYAATQIQMNSKGRNSSNISVYSQ